MTLAKPNSRLVRLKAGIVFILKVIRVIFPDGLIRVDESPAPMGTLNE